MKLLVQSDDYGITMGTAYGALHAIEHGIVRNTGLFANMRHAPACVELIRPYFDEISFGIDLNAVNGPSVLGYDEVPSLCHPDGTFLSIAENRALDTPDNDMDHVDGEQLHAEFCAQVRQFAKMTGRKPDYIHGHAYATKTTEAVIRKIVRDYGIPYTGDFALLPDAVMPTMGWYTFGTMEEQLKEDPLSYITEDRAGYLSHSYGYLITHCGMLDPATMQLPFNLCRLRDLEAVTSDAVHEWIRMHDIQLINFRDIAPMLLSRTV